MKDRAKWEIEVDKIENCPQRQDSTVNQLQDLVVVANKLGFYDATDAIRSMIKNSK